MEIKGRIVGDHDFPSAPERGRVDSLIGKDWINLHLPRGSRAVASRKGQRGTSHSADAAIFSKVKTAENPMKTRDARHSGGQGIRNKELKNQYEGYGRPTRKRQ
jgi:hypothetical protein